MSIRSLRKGIRWFFYIIGTIPMIVVFIEVVLGYPIIIAPLADRFLPPPTVSMEAKQASSDRTMATTSTPQSDYREWFVDTDQMIIGGIPVEVSVARTLAERVQGLSGTPGLPEHMVKLFIFPEPGAHSIWMKDMNYPIDIAWVDSDLRIVHVEADVDPSTYPNSFSSPVPALYVIEANAGFFRKNNISVGAVVVLPRGATN
jgi:uncharacterized membrane protein (UPF0127 family)